MATRLATKTALAAFAAVGLFLPFGAPLPGSCLRTVGIAGAAPSPSCSGDLRECLRASADLHQTTFGGRYVTADDVARCMEAFRSCVSGGASRGGNQAPPTSTSPDGGNNAVGLPQRFQITYGGTAISCRADGNQVSCSGQRGDLPSAMSGTATFTGTLSGSTLSGTETANSSLAPGPNTCGAKSESSGPVTFVLGANGIVKVSKGTFQTEESYFGTPSVTGGDCSINGPRNYSVPGYEFSATWSAIE